MSEEKTESPKAFISYSWSSAEHEAWVLQLATELEESGVHVIIDKWDLREGADKYAYMEKMVTDESVRKVVVICDKTYAEKADGREGGVGTETQIISQELYDQIDLTDQEQKFVAVISEKDESGNPYIPTFLKSRIYIDMSDPTLRTSNYEQLLRWIFDQPLFKRPERGKPPPYLFEESDKSLGTTSRFRQAVDALKQNRESALGLCRDYFETFAENLEVFRIVPERGKQFDDQVVESIEAFLPYRDEIVELFITIARYRSDLEIYELVHSFFERILPYGYWPEGQSSWSDQNADNFKFFHNELFLYAVAAFLKNQRFDGVNELIEKDYYFDSNSPEAPKDRMAPFTYFNTFLSSLGDRNKRLKLNRLSLMADFLKKRAQRHDLPFSDIMQADFVLYIRAELQPISEGIFRREWWPHSLVFAARYYPTFEIFARAQSTRYFDKMKIVLGINDKEQLINLLKEYTEGKRNVPRWHFDSLDPVSLMGIDRIATRP